MWYTKYTHLRLPPTVMSILPPPAAYTWEYSRVMMDVMLEVLKKMPRPPPELPPELDSMPATSMRTDRAMSSTLALTWGGGG